MKEFCKDKNTVVLLVTDKSTSAITHLFKDLEHSLLDIADVLLAYHQKEDLIPESIQQLKHFAFSNDILTKLGYIPLGKTLVPGNNHFPLLQFFRNSRKYDRYWIIEDDVRFSGSWRFFFDSFSLIDADFISCNIRHWQDEPHWYWWNDFKHKTKLFPLEKRIASFNPIYRISHDALKFIDYCLKDKWQGHHEILFPSLLKYGGYKLMDFGGDGKYVQKGFENQFYHAVNSQVKGVLSEGTMRCKPAMGYIGYLNDKLYHPVKCFNEQPQLFYETSSKRMAWIMQMDVVARPVIENLANENLRGHMPVYLSKRINHRAPRSDASYLEAFGRTFSGIAPWLNSCSGNEEEQLLRKQYREWMLKAVVNAVNPESKDYLIGEGRQAPVEVSYFALALIRCPWLWENLDKEERRNVVNAFLLTKNTVPVNTNWILFSGVIEVFFCRYGLEYDTFSIEYGVREFLGHWYKGDGIFSGGMQFHLDYYNSIVVQPFLSAILDVVSIRTGRNDIYLEKLELINKRYAEIQERMINADGSFSVVGKSVAYRAGIFHHLADMSLRKRLPDTLAPPKIREALFAVIKKTLQVPDTTDKNGWLRNGLCGEQTGLEDSYITTGSLYMCMNVFLPLGLPNSDSFWHLPSKPRTSVNIRNGDNVNIDKTLDI